MFQYASLRGIAANNNLEFCIPPEDTVTHANYGLFDCFNLPNAKHHQLIGPQAPMFACLLYTSPSPRDRQKSRMPSSA